MDSIDNVFTANINDDKLEESNHSLSTTSTQLMDNLHETKRAFLQSPASPSSQHVSKNSLAASRLLRNRKDRGNRAKAAQQLMERMTPTKSLPISSGESPAMTKESIPPASPSSLRNRVKNRHRGTGGAFAKLMVQGPATSPCAGEEADLKAVDEAAEASPSKEAQAVQDTEVVTADSTVKEFEGLRKMTVAEFSTGPQSNLRYHMKPDEEVEENKADEDEIFSEASVPSILNRAEIFHQNAAAAVVALLTPRHRGGDQGSIISSASTLEEAGLRVTPSNRGLIVTAERTTVSAFRNPGVSSIHATGSVLSSYSSAALDLSYDGAVPRSPITEPILSAKAGTIVENVKTKMIDPSKTLSDLLTSIASPENGESMDRGYMVRRKNACGALKVLTATPSNRHRLCWTIGVLPALTSVLEDTDDSGLDETFPDRYTRSEYIEARKRAVASLVNLAILKQNRIPIFHCPGLVQAVSCVIQDDKEESRQGSCALIAYLCKTQDNRLLMAQVPGLLNALCSVIIPTEESTSSLTTNAKKKKYHWDDSDEDNSAERLDSFSSDVRDMTAGTDGSDRYTSSFRTDEDSEVTIQTTPSPRKSPSPRKNAVQQPTNGYDNDPNTFLHGARKNVFAALEHLVKEKDNAYAFARNELLMKTLVDISKLHSSPSHIHAIKILANLTRHRSNAKHIVFKVKFVLPALVQATQSSHDEARQYALYAIQNLAQSQHCRQEIANTKDLIMALCQRIRQSHLPEERLTALAALKNLTDDPSNLIPMSNTAECFATLMQIAHGSDGDVKMQYLACDALATLSHWLRKIATSGSTEVAMNSTETLFVPSLAVVSFEQWT